MQEKTLNSLVINKVENQEVYDKMVAAGQINEDELYLVNGETNSVTSPFIDWTAQYNKLLENGADAQASLYTFGFMLNPDGTYLMDDGMYRIFSRDQTYYLTVKTATVVSTTVRMVESEYFTDDPFFCKEIWIKPIDASDPTLVYYISDEENLVQLGEYVANLPAVSTRDNGKILKVVNGNWQVVDP